MNYALIGCGRIAVNHIKAAQRNHLTISAICDGRPEAMEALLSKCEIDCKNTIKRYTDYRQMLAENHFDIVAVATESGSHAKIALDCIDRKMHVLIEKPMALRMSDADEIIRRSECNGVKVCVCHQNRFNAAVRAVYTALKEGRFGRLSHGTVHVRWNRNRVYYEQAPWRGTWMQDGGCLMNQCIHGIDLLCWLLGDQMDEIYGTTKRQIHDYLECEDVGMAIVKFHSGTIGMIEGTTNVYPKNLEEALYLFGENGTVKLGGTSTNRVDIWEFADERPEDQKVRELNEMANNVYGNGHTALYADLIDAVRTNREPLVDARAGRNALQCVLAIYSSSASGMPVRMPVKNVSCMDFQGLFV